MSHQYDPVSEGAEGRHQYVPASLDVQPAAAGGERAVRGAELAKHLLIAPADEPGLVRDEVHFLRHASQGNGAMPSVYRAASRGRQGG